MSAKSANSSTSMQDELIMRHLAVQIIFCALYLVILFLGIFGNVLVCYVVYSNKAMQTVTNLFITNLALSDILLCLGVPFTPLYTFLGRWLFGDLICHMVPYVQVTSLYISVLTLSAIAVDRYFVILHPLRQRMRIRTCLLILCGIWTFSMLITLPYGISMKVYEADGTMVCEEDWFSVPGIEFQIAFGCFTLVMQFVIPFTIITYCYFRISKRLNERAKSKPGTKSAKREEVIKEKKKRTNRMLIAMVTIFGICWLPMNIINLCYDFKYENLRYFHLLFSLSHCMAMSSTCYNPFLYAWLNENFRKEFKEVLPCALNVRANRYCNGDEHTLDTLLHSTVPICASPVKQLEPREPIAERIINATQLEYKL